MTHLATRGTPPIAALLVIVAACSARDGSPGGRVVAVHNALQAVGFSRLGEVSDGVLGQGQTARLTVSLEQGACYVFMVAGDSGVADVDLELVSPGGEQIGRDSTSDAQAVVQACARETGDHTLTVTMTRGQGSYVVAQWSGSAATGGGPIAALPGGRTEGTCANPIALELGTPVSGDTSQATELGDGTCIPGGAPDVAYQFSVDHDTHVCFNMSSVYDGALILQRECGQAVTEVSCNDDDIDTRHSAISAGLTPGTYYLLASGFDDSRGSFTINSMLADAAAPSDVCAQAAPMSPGQVISGTTAGCLPDNFQATCAGGARSAERVYRLDVPSRSRVRVAATQNTHDGALYVRSDCMNPTAEIACNDDHMDTRHSLVTTVLDPGTYYVFADGYGEGNGGAFTLEAQLAAIGQGQVPGDSCSSAQTLTAGLVTGNTMPAQADTTGSCAPSPGAADLVYQVNLREATRLRARVNQSDMRTAVYVQSTCGDASTEVVCDTTGSLERVLQPGNYYLIVDGVEETEFGAFELGVEMTSTRAIEAVCRQAPQLTPQQSATGTTQGSDEFHASCAGGAASAEAIYQLRLQRRQLVRLTLDTPSHDGALFVRRTCLDESTEVACNDDDMDTRHSRIELVLDRGTYYVFVDGFSTGSQGPYTLRVELQNP